VRGGEIAMIFQDEIVVMYAGRVVEDGGKRDLLHDPRHPFTWGRLGSIPSLDREKLKRLHSIEGAPPSLINLPQGRKLRPRCPDAFDQCTEEPRLENRVEHALRVATIAGEVGEAA